MLPVFQNYEPHLESHYFLSLERVLRGWSVDSDPWALACCDGARAIVIKPISKRERLRELHRFICDVAPDCGA
jgi:hypothetical protein